MNAKKNKKNLLVLVSPLGTPRGEWWRGEPAPGTTKEPEKKRIKDFVHGF